MIKLPKRINVKKFGLFLLAFGLGLLSPWMLADKILAQSSAENPAGIIKGATKEGFPYMSGGIGTGAREIMQSWGGNYNLKLTFSELSGNYLADVKLVLEDANGKEVISTMTNGPWFYIQLPPGNYTVKADFEGETKQIKNLRLAKAERVTRLLHWDLD